MRSPVVVCLLAVLLTLGIADSASGQAKAKPKPKAASKSKTQPKSISTISAPAPATTETKCGANGLTETEVVELVAGHNKARADVRLQPITWDCRLANMAQEWASKSVYEHSDTDLGENIFVSGDPNATMGTVMERWIGERMNWNNSAGTCAGGKVCTHYTQIVWKPTLRFGCGINRNSTGKWKSVLVCNYAPASKNSGPAY